MTEPTTWQRRMRAFQNELHKNDPHTNAMEVFLVYPNDFLGMTFSSSMQNIATVRTIGQWMKSVQEGKPPPLCATCDHELADFLEVRAFIVGQSLFARDSGHMLVSGVCFRCVKRNPQELLDAYYRDLKKIGLARDKLQQGSA
jgi:hypothetical protein